MPARCAQFAARSAQRAHRILVACSILAAASCVRDGSVEREFRNPAMAQRMADSALTLEGLQALNLAYADRYLTTIATACDEIIANNPDPLQRAYAARLKVSYITAIYDVVTSDDPVSQVVDLALVVTLQSQIYIDDGRAHALFGDRAQPLVLAIRRAREEIWSLGERLFSPDEQDYFDRLIWAWRKENPHVNFVGYVRFEEFANERAIIIVGKARSSSGFLAPVDEARRAVEDARMLAERVFFLAKRMPMILEWQVESTVSDLLIDPEVKELVDGHEEIAPALRGVNTALIGLDDRIRTVHEGIFTEIDARLTNADGLVARAEAALADVQQLVADIGPLVDAANPLVGDLRAAAEALDTSAATAQQIVDRVSVPPGDPRFKPFDIAEYAATARSLAEAAQSLQTTLDQAQELLASGEVDGRIAAEHIAIVKDASALLDKAFWRLAALIGLAFALLVVYRWWTARSFRSPR